MTSFSVRSLSEKTKRMIKQVSHTSHSCYPGTDIIRTLFINKLVTYWLIPFYIVFVYNLINVKNNRSKNNRKLEHLSFLSKHQVRYNKNGSGTIDCTLPVHDELKDDSRVWPFFLLENCVVNFTGWPLKS